MNDVESISKIINSNIDKHKKIYWVRKHDRIKKLIEQINKIEDEINDIIIKEKLPLMDSIEKLRTELVNDCIHPKEFLVIQNNNKVLCKFCNRKLILPEN